ncbi:MAG: hypothetical protein MHPSP_003521, partial [Paramarteilia canceri]
DYGPVNEVPAKSLKKMEASDFFNSDSMFNNTNDYPPDETNNNTKTPYNLDINLNVGYLNGILKTIKNINEGDAASTSMQESSNHNKSAQNSNVTIDDVKNFINHLPRL